MTILEVLIQSLRKAGTFNKDVQAAPACILWPDKERQWETIMPILRTRLPHLLALGKYDHQKKIGSAIWLKCMIARTLPEADWPEDFVPVLYLPGIGRADLRAIETCPKELQPLAELQYRGTFWSQKNGKDWTLFAFLKSQEGGAGLDVAHDEKTLEAIHRAFSLVLVTSIHDLDGRRLEAQDFDALLSPDPVKDVLRWLNDPVTTQAGWTKEEREAFQALCRSSFKFNPSSDGELTGAELLVKGEDKWGEVWNRFTEAPELYPKLPGLLRRTQSPSDLFVDKERWPQINEQEEKSLRQELLKIVPLATHEARARINALETQHGKRRSWVWARLGSAPLAQALKHLNEIALLTGTPITGETAEELRISYTGHGWQVDKAVLQTLAITTKADDVAAVQGVVRCLYEPWLEDCAVRFQKAVAENGYPSAKDGSAEPYDPGECMLFVDGLRYDVAQMLKDSAEKRSCIVGLSSSWAALPTITATTKPAVSPISCNLSGTSPGEDFVPLVADTGKKLTPYSFKKMLEDNGWEVCAAGEAGNPDGNAWCETGAIDRQGHEQGWKLARRLNEELSEAVDYLEKLLDAGWKRIRVITDHGWLLLPSGLPKAELAKCLTETRWGRCAILKESAKVEGMVVAWRWSKDVYVAVPHGIGCYTAGREYDHGGLTLQECVIPLMIVSRPEGVAVKAKIAEQAWRGLRCKAMVETDATGLKCDIRTKAGDPSSSVVKGGKEIEKGGAVSMVVEDDGLIGTAVFLVVLSPQGAVIAKESTTVGGG